MNGKNRLNRLTLIMAVCALIVSLGVSGGPALAKVVFANNSDKVDGKHAVGAFASINQRKGKLVATSASTGRLPDNIIRKAPNADLLDGKDASRFLRSGSSASRIAAAGLVRSNGTPFWVSGPRVTAARLGQGQYDVRIAGLQSCADEDFPPGFLGTPFGAEEVGLEFIGTDCASHDVTFRVLLSDSAGALVDSSFSFIVLQAPGLSSNQLAARNTTFEMCVLRSTRQVCR